MFDSSSLKLQIPAKVVTRNEIREKVDNHFKMSSIWPPVSLEALSEMAAKLMRDNGWDEINRGFVMLCCGNAIWRKVVETIPFHRRILLLPQCLKHSSLCQAEMDNIGLLCNDCGECSITSVVHEAENSGYVALVTEGTTITTKLIESGKVDAVIGVGCMEVLQKMFNSVSKFAVPGIGIPLLTNGCRDTKADVEWIRQELNHFREDPAVRLLNLNHIRNKTASIFGEEQLQQFLIPGQDETMKIIIRSLLAGGQRIRPFLATLAYEAFSAETDNAILNRLALSVECFHKASLIHDDIEDNDSFRYGKQTIHALHGTAVAINAGDLLIGEGYRLIAESCLPTGMLNDCIKIIASGHRSTTLGQGAELLATSGRKIVSLNQVLEIFDNKTASAFRVSLLLGGTIGGASEDSLSSLEQFSLFTGIAYQVKDDLEDFSGNKGDIRFRRPSVLLSLLIEAVTQNDLEIIVKAYAAGDYKAVCYYIKSYKIEEICTELLKKYILQAKESIDSLENLGLKLALHEILGKIFDKYI